MIISVMLAEPARASEALTLSAGESYILELTEPADTVIIGDPKVVQAVVQNGQTLILNGTRLGTTNLVATGSSGRIIQNRRIVVGKAIDNSTRLFRGPKMEAYTCTPYCEQEKKTEDSAFPTLTE